MKRWRLLIEYEGSGFCGWQKQNHVLSVQQVLEEAIEKFSGEKVDLFTAGRTDAGVHAAGQVAHFDLEKDFPANKIADAINFYVRPHRVSILMAEEARDDFHARFSAIARAYRYTIINRKAPPVLNPMAWHIERRLDEGLMQQAALCLMGHHDFSTFRAQNCQAKSPMKTLDRFDITRDGEKIYFDLSARSFLYHQVRNMVGTLVLVGSGRWTVDGFKSAFEAKNRAAGGPTSPPDGLCLTSVTYPDEDKAFFTAF